MGHIYREKAEIDIPPRAHVNNHNAQVSIYDLDSRGHRTGSRKVIGLATSATTMHPNENFKLLFPELWMQYYGEEVLQYEIHVGLYGALLGLAHKRRLYPILDALMGHPDANAFMDYVMYNIDCHSNAAQLLEDSLHGKMTFSTKVRSDSFYCDLFQDRIAKKGVDAAFRAKWLAQCASEGVKKVWICVDGSNNDCRVQDSGLAELGKAKSLKNVTIFSFIWAVEAETGRPVTWTVNSGNTHDSKAFDAIIKLLGASGIQVEGVILDKGFASQQIVDAIRARGYDFVLKLPNNNIAHKEMVEQYADEIRWDLDRALDADDYEEHRGEQVVYGITDRKKIFASDDQLSTIGLYFDEINGADRSNHSARNVLEAAKAVRRQICKNPDKAAIPADMKRYLRFEYGDDGKPSKVCFNNDVFRKDASQIGFSSIACSRDLSAAELDRLYDLRDISEKQFSILKSHLGFSTTRVHSDIAIKSRMTAAFAASILRTELSLCCQKLHLDTNVMIRQLNRLTMICGNDGKFRSVRNMSQAMKKLLFECGLTEDSFDEIANEFNSRRKAVHSDFRAMPQTVIEPKKVGRPLKVRATENQDSVVKRGRGRPKGSKNKKTLERERLALQQEQVAKRGPGRPKGSKNKKTLEREKLMQQQQELEQPVKRKPGRPKGSKNKKTLAREAAEALLQQKAERLVTQRAKRAVCKKASESVKK